MHDDGDWETAADKAQLHAFSHAGQSCISVQRILVHESIADDFTARFVKNVERARRRATRWTRTPTSAR